MAVKYILVCCIILLPGLEHTLANQECAETVKTDPDNQDGLSDLRDDLQYLKTNILNRLDNLDEKTEWCLSSKGEVINAKSVMDILETTQSKVDLLVKYTLPTDCWDKPGREDGLYDIPIGGRMVQVHCSYMYKGPAWTLIQKRVDGSTDFDRTWEEYKQGFGRPDHNFWLGNENIHLLTSAHSYELFMNLTLRGGGQRYHLLTHFELLNEQNLYQLNIDVANRNDPHSLMASNGTAFMTKDRQMPLIKSYIFADKTGGWWHDCSSTQCFISMNMNGVYAELKDKMKSLSVVEMKIRRVVKDV